MFNNADGLHFLAISFFCTLTTSVSVDPPPYRPILKNPLPLPPEVGRLLWKAPKGYIEFLFWLSPSFKFLLRFLEFLSSSILSHYVNSIGLRRFKKQFVL